MNFETSVKGFLVGGVLGALASHLLTGGASGPSRTEEETSEPKGFDPSIYPYAASDYTLAASLQEPSAVFWKIDKELCERMLSNFEELAMIACESRKSVTSPLLLARALKAKRSANEALQILIRKTRGTKPLLAEGITEDVENLKRHLSDSLHNIDQEQGLQRSSAA